MTKMSKYAGDIPDDTIESNTQMDLTSILDDDSVLPSSSDDIPVLTDDIDTVKMAHLAALGDALIEVGVEGWIYYHNALKLVKANLGDDYDDGILPNTRGL